MHSISYSENYLTLLAWSIQLIEVTITHDDRVNMLKFSNY
jgi:hypothetical protein